MLESIASFGSAPWGQLGADIAEKDNIESILTKAKLDWEVHKKPLWFSDEDGRHHAVPGRWALIRSTDNAVLSDCVAAKYRPIQNSQILEFFREFCEAGKMQIEHAGSLHYGKFIWALARVKEADFVIGKGNNADEVKAFCLLLQAHKVGHSMTGHGLSARSWCWNTLTAKLKGGQFRWPHIAEFGPDAMKRAREVLGLVVTEMTEFKQQATFLAKKKVSESQVNEFFYELLDYNPEKAEKKKDGTPKEPKLLKEFKIALHGAPGQQLSTAKSTWWGAVNAVTYVLDHKIGTDKNAALHNSWFSQRAEMKRRAVGIALAKAA